MIGLGSDKKRYQFDCGGGFSQGARVFPTSSLIMTPEDGCSLIYSTLLLRQYYTYSILWNTTILYYTKPYYNTIQWFRFTVTILQLHINCSFDSGGRSLLLINTRRLPPTHSLEMIIAFKPSLVSSTTILD